MFFHNPQYPVLVSSAITTCGVRKITSLFLVFNVFTDNFFGCSLFWYYKCSREAFSPPHTHTHFLNLFSSPSQNIHVFTLTRNGPLFWMASEIFYFLRFYKKNENAEMYREISINQEAAKTIHILLSGH